MIDFKFLVFADLDVSCVETFAANEDGLVGKCWYYVNCAIWLSNWVVQFFYISSCMVASISNSKNFGRRLAYLDEWVAYFT